ncbi:hypothetical protein BST38_15600 [Mycolicibacterium parafortuitum]|nr:hypothetical protein BST38_15600 [Mycolicibacterium parafortuitum]
MPQSAAHASKPNAPTHARTDARTHGRTDARTHGRTDARTHGRTDARRLFRHSRMSRRCGELGAFASATLSGFQHPRGIDPTKSSLRTTAHSTASIAKLLRSRQSASRTNYPQQQHLSRNYTKQSEGCDVKYRCRNF